MCTVYRLWALAIVPALPCLVLAGPAWSQVTLYAKPGMGGAGVEITSNVSTLTAFSFDNRTRSIVVHGG
jgi:hypothetical protein